MKFKFPQLLKTTLAITAITVLPMDRERQLSYLIYPEPFSFHWTVLLEEKFLIKK